MPRNVLIASLGDHPAVVTGMVKILQIVQELNLHEVVVLHTAGSGKLIRLGYDLVKQVLEGEGLTVADISPLPFADPLTMADSMEFLRILAGILEGYEASNDQVYLSLAGGRKNMSALMAVIPQFYPAVRGLFHLLNKMDKDFPTVEELVYMTHEQQLATMSPPDDQMKLVKIPYAHFANALQLRRYFRATEKDEDYSVTISSAAEAFYDTVWHPQTELPLQIYFSKTALTEYRQMEGTSHQKIFDNYIRDMQKPDWFDNNIHPLVNFDTDCYCLKKGGRGSGSTQERPFVYRQGNRVIICRLTLHGSTYEQLIDLGYLWQKDHPPFKSLAELNEEELVLLVPLGESPMVASQTFTLLQMQNREWPARKIAALVVVYPQENGVIENGAYLLEKRFNEQNIDFVNKPIVGLSDVDSEENCRLYLQALLKTIDELKTQHPSKEIGLSLSGGRKGMSALSLFSAQKAGIKQVYHTLITDSQLELQVQKESSYEVLSSKTRTEQEDILFLKRYDTSKFTLFSIPVINLILD